MTNEDVKPDVEESSIISLNFRCNDGSEMVIRVRGSTKFGKVMRSYTEKQGRAPGSVKFGFEGTRINDYETPDMLGIEDGDQIDVNLEQLGGTAP